jgi:hypothetical protein
VIVKLLLIGSVLVVLAWVVRSRPTHHRLAVARLASVGIAVCWIIAVLYPGLTTWLANKIGVGRGTDLLLYVLVVVFTVTTVGQYQRMRRMEDQLAALTRANALLDRKLDDLQAHHRSPATDGDPPSV